MVMDKNFIYIIVSNDNSFIIFLIKFEKCTIGLVRRVAGSGGAYLKK